MTVQAMTSRQIVAKLLVGLQDWNLSPGRCDEPCPPISARCVGGLTAPARMRRERHGGQDRSASESPLPWAAGVWQMWEWRPGGCAERADTGGEHGPAATQAGAGVAVRAGSAGGERDGWRGARRRRLDVARREALRSAGVHPCGSGPCGPLGGGPNAREVGRRPQCRTTKGPRAARKRSLRATGPWRRRGAAPESPPGARSARSGRKAPLLTHARGRRAASPTGTEIGSGSAMLRPAATA